MIPFVAMVSVRGYQSRTLRLWVPLFLVWLLLMPLVVLLSPAIFIGCLVCRVNPFCGLAAIWQLLSALSHTECEFEQGSAGVSFYIL